MICEFLDYYSSRFDLNRCIFSSAVIRTGRNVEPATGNSQHKLYPFKILTRQSILSFFPHQFFWMLDRRWLVLVHLLLLLCILIANVSAQRLPVRTKCIHVIILYDSKEMWPAILKSKLCIWNREYGSSTTQQQNEYSFERWNHNSNFVHILFIYNITLLLLLLLAYRFDENQYFNFFLFFFFSFSFLFLWFSPFKRDSIRFY